MEKTNKLKTTVDEFLTEENDVKKDETTEKVKTDSKEENLCTTEECRMKSRTGLIERVDKKFVTSDGRQLLND